MITFKFIGIVDVKITLHSGSTHSMDVDITIMKDKIYQQLKQVIEPSFNINIVDLGLIYDVIIKSHRVALIRFSLIDLKQQSQSWVDKMRTAVEAVPHIGGVDLELVTDPVWTRARMSVLAAKQTGLIFFGGNHG